MINKNKIIGSKIVRSRFQSPGVKVGEYPKIKTSGIAYESGVFLITEDDAFFITFEDDTYIELD